MVNPNQSPIIRCPNCKEEKEHHAKGLCYQCYRKQWKGRIVKCKNCGEMKRHHAKGYCDYCAVKKLYYHIVQRAGYKKSFGLNLDNYKLLTQKCIICGFKEIVDLHHFDEDSKNNILSNLIPLCPNHHKMFHGQRYRDKIVAQIKDKKEELSVLYKKVK